MGSIRFVAMAFCACVAACQDSAASNSERDTHMGTIHAEAPPVLDAAGSADSAAPAPMAPATTMPPTNGVPTVPASASAAPTVSAPPSGFAHAPAAGIPASSAPMRPTHDAQKQRKP